MAVTLNDVDHVAKLARLSFSESEKETLAHELNDILKYMEQLNSLDTTNVEPLAHVIALSNVFRDDEARPTVSRDEALKNAPAKNDEFFKVPKVIADR
jgi:aspartyl-tRNA(Asn)/glutamyl-tRNA(Gln) amidotransferase subunit C